MTPRRTGFGWHERMMWHDPGRHVGFVEESVFLQPAEGRDMAEPRRRLRNLLEAAGLLPKLVPLSTRGATLEELHRVHSPEYVAAVSRVSERGGRLPGETVWISRHGFDIAALAAGSCVEAVAAVLDGAADNAYVLARPPGHHAGWDVARGGCVFNNVAIAAAHALHAGLERVAIIDIDAHHGNGTQEAFYASSHVLTISVHQNQSFAPGTGDIEARGRDAGYGYNINVPLPPGSGRGAYMAVLDRVVTPALDWFEPELVLVACGLDANTQDPSARMMLHSEAFAAIAAVLIDAAERHCGGRLVCCQEGGYSDVYVPFCGLAVFEQLLGVDSGVRDPFLARWERFSGDPLAPHQSTAVELARHGLPFS